MASSNSQNQIQAVPGNVDPALRPFLTAMRQALVGLTNPTSNSRAVTINDLTNAGLLSVGANNSLTTSIAAGDFTEPSAITGFAVSGAFASIILSWDRQKSTVGYVEIFRSTTNDIGTAVKVGQTASSVFSDTPPNSSITTTYYYWVRAVSTGGIVGPFNAVAGTAGSTASDPTYAIQVLTGQVSSSQLNAELNNVLDSAAEAILAGVSDVYTKYTDIKTQQAQVTKNIGDITANASSITTLQASVSTNAGNIIANASSITSLTASVGSNTAAITVEESVRAQTIAADWVAGTAYVAGDTVTYNGAVYVCTTANSDLTWTAANWALSSNVYGQYTVKIDTNGKVIGFGLSSGDPNTASSIFEVVADKFAIVKPDGTGSVVPFVVDATSGIVYMDVAMIKDATITSAKIASLAADKISAGTVTAAIQLNAANIYGGSIAIGANFSVDSAGNMTGVNATLSGSMSVSGHVSSGQTAFNTGSGFWLDGTGKLSVGNSSYYNIAWDGSTLSVYGNIYPTYTNGSIPFASAFNTEYSATFSNSGSVQGYGSWTQMQTFTVNGIGTIEISIVGYAHSLSSSGTSMFNTVAEFIVKQNGTQVSSTYSISLGSPGLGVGADTSTSTFNMTLSGVNPGDSISVWARAGGSALVAGGAYAYVQAVVKSFTLKSGTATATTQTN